MWQNLGSSFLYLFQSLNGSRSGLLEQRCHSRLRSVSFLRHPGVVLTLSHVAALNDVIKMFACAVQSSILSFSTLAPFTRALAELLAAMNGGRRPHDDRGGGGDFPTRRVTAPIRRRRPLTVLSAVLSRHGDRPRHSANHCPQFDAHVSDRTIHTCIDFLAASRRTTHVVRV